MEPYSTPVHTERVAHLTLQGLDVLRTWDRAALEDGAP